MRISATGLASLAHFPPTEADVWVCIIGVSAGLDLWEPVSNPRLPILAPAIKEIIMRVDKMTAMTKEKGQKKAACRSGESQAEYKM